ncbi:hypothetical protein MKEN_00816300 [Mycena kentingensis (nom. inval.)]|nr:hypothetical protein MKEN_00816300 [Mycena kentingensis (nom. inval.)]
MDLRGGSAERWTSLLEQQTGSSQESSVPILPHVHVELFKQTVEENALLRGRVAELERELGVWKVAFSKADDDMQGLRGTNTQLQQLINSIHNDNPLLLALIDGDGSIFHQNLVVQGHTGGRQAAQILSQSLMNNARNVDPQLNRAKLWLTVFCNRAGLVDTLVTQELCTREQFDAFFSGFNSAAPLFSMVDVGPGKEAADTKIKEYLRIFPSFPQTSLVFFGGSHDNGYTAAVAALENEGLLNKLIMLRSYKDDVARHAKFQLNEIFIEGLFIERKLPASIFPRFKGNQINHQPSGHAPPSPKKNARARDVVGGDSAMRYLAPNVPLQKQSPPPCTFYYLAICKHGEKCHYGHSYILTSTDYASLREYAKKTPCVTVNRNKPCPSGDENCPFGHLCPRGSSCSRKMCKFTGSAMHNGVGVNEAETCLFSSTIMVSAYERQRAANIQRNQELLRKLGGPTLSTSPCSNQRRSGAQKSSHKPRNARQSIRSTPTRPRHPRTDDTDGPRRSARNSGKKVDYKAEKRDSFPLPLAVSAGIRSLENGGRLGREAGSKRIHDPKVYGKIPGIEPGTWWETREGCSADAVHAPWVAGISGGPGGAYSIALSGGYADDVDNGYAFTYTGCGASRLIARRLLTVYRRSRSQSSDQNFENKANQALLKSSKTLRPVRVIRGFKVPSPYAPYEGYRYDGLYQVEKAWLDDGLEGFKVCKFLFKRLPGQSALPRRDEEAENVGRPDLTQSTDADVTDSDEQEEEGIEDE